MRTSSIFGAVAIACACAACGEEAAPRAENDASAGEASVDATSADASVGASDSTIDSTAESSGDSAVVDDATIEAADGDAVVANPRDLDAIVYAMFDSSTKTSHVWKAYPDPDHFGQFLDATDLTAWALPGDEAEGPFWSKDRTKIYWWYEPRGSGDGGSWVMNADGSAPAARPPGALSSVETPDGRYVVVENDDATHWHLAVVDASGMNEIAITRPGFQDIAPTLSPDGAHVAFATNRPDPSSQGSSIYVVDIDGANLHPLVNGEGGDDFPAWSPSGDRIAFRRDFPGSVLTCEGDDIWTVAPDGTGLTNLTNFDACPPARLAVTDRLENPVWSPDGTSLIVADDHRTYEATPGPCPPDCEPQIVERFEVLMMKADGSSRTEVTGLGVPPDPPEDCSGNTPPPEAGPARPCFQPANPFYVPQLSW